MSNNINENNSIKLLGVITIEEKDDFNGELFSSEDYYLYYDYGNDQSFLILPNHTATKDFSNCITAVRKEVDILLNKFTKDSM